MTEQTWRPFGTGKYRIPAKPTGLWTKVSDFVEGPVKLRFEAEGTWMFSKKTCGPDGSVRDGLFAEALLPSTPVGALIGKVGGSSADKPDPAKATVFAVGSYCVITLEATARGALFLTMNDVVGRFDEHEGEVEVTITNAR